MKVPVGSSAPVSSGLNLCSWGLKDFNTTSSHLVQTWTQWWAAPRRPWRPFNTKLRKIDLKKRTGVWRRNINVRKIHPWCEKAFKVKGQGHSDLTESAFWPCVRRWLKSSWSRKTKWTLKLCVVWSLISMHHIKLLLHSCCVSHQKTSSSCEVKLFNPAGFNKTSGSDETDESR